MLRSTSATALALSAFCLAAPIPAAASESSDGVLARGKYLATIMDCGGCHTPGALLGKPEHDRPLAGSRIGFQIPGLGIFYPPNLTPDSRSGLGNWSVEDIVQAVRAGVRPDGRILAPVMPYKNYGALTDTDATALASYLKTLKPVRHEVPAPAGSIGLVEAPFLAVISPKAQ
jgi:mono/diheme cytochrome c family protein